MYHPFLSATLVWPSVLVLLFILYISCSTVTVKSTLFPVHLSVEGKYVVCDAFSFKSAFP